MNPVRQKLNDRRGASILIALVFVIVALMVGAVVLTAASGNAGRVTHNRQDQREYLAVSSAVDLLREDLADLTLTGSYTKTVVETTTTSVDEEGVEHTHTTRSAPAYAKSAGLSGSELLAAKEDAFAQLYYSTLPNEGGLREPAPVISYPLRFSADSGRSVPAVSGTLTAILNGEGKYEIDVTLTCEGEDGVKSNPILMVFLGTAKKTESHTKSFDGPDTTLRDEYRTTVEWEPPVIRKGVS